MTIHDQPPDPADATTYNYDDIGTPSPILVLLLVIPLLGILAALLLMVKDLQEKRTTLPPPISNPSAQIYYAAPDFRLDMLDGGVADLEEYRGKVLFLNFWQTTCVPCITEMPEFMAFMDDQNPDEVALLAINFDETPEDIRRFFEQYDIVGIPTALDRDASVAQRYGVSGIPITYIISAAGEVRSLSIGGMNYEEMQERLEIVQGLAD